MTEQDIKRIKLLIQAEAENLACMYEKDISYQLQHITKHYNKLETFLKNND